MCHLRLQLIQRGADVQHIGQAKGGHGTTMALHECAAMRGEKGQAPEAYYETAWLLMAVGASPFTERSDGPPPFPPPIYTHTASDNHFTRDG